MEHLLTRNQSRECWIDRMLDGVVADSAIMEMTGKETAPEPLQVVEWAEVAVVTMR